MNKMMTTFEKYRPKLEIIREIGSLMAHMDDTWIEHDDYTLTHIGDFIFETIAEFREAMYKADDDTPEEKAAQLRALEKSTGKEASNA
jgi:hypothetical protein